MELKVFRRCSPLSSAQFGVFWTELQENSFTRSEMSGLQILAKVTMNCWTGTGALIGLFETLLGHFDTPIRYFGKHLEKI